MKRLSEMPSKKAQEGGAAVKKAAAAAATPTKREAAQLLEGNDANGGAAVKRRKGLGVRVIGGRIYDSENGTTCHQCRQKTIDFMAPCKAIVGKKACTQNFCAKCLLNRYGEKVAEVAQLQNWSCPRCRGDCNCSICLKKQGCAPTGILTPTAKATGFTSVADLLKKRPAVKAESVTLSAPPTQQAAQKGSKKGCPIDDPSEKGDGRLVEEAVLGERAGTPTRSSGKRGGSASKKRKLIVTAEGEVEGPVANALLSSSPSRQKTSAVAKALLTTSTANQKIAKKTPVAKQTLLDEVLRIKSKKIVTFSANPNEDLGVVPLNAIPEISEQVQVLPVKAKKKKKSEKERNARVPPPAEVIDSKQLVSNSNVKATKKDFKDIGNVGTDIINVTAETGYETCIDAGGKALPKKATKRKEKPIEDDGQKQQRASKNTNPEARDPKKRSQARGSQFAAVEEEIVMPQGKSLVMVAGMDFPAEAVGPALQLVEFCSAFNTVLGLKRGDAEAMLRELTKGRLVRRGPNSLLVQLHAKLLNLIEQGSSQSCGKVSQFSSGKNSWLHILKKHVTERSCVFSGLTTNKEDTANGTFPKTASFKASLEKDLRAIMDAIEGGAESYENLGMYHKLQLLIILCDDSLETECMRSFIDSANREFCDAQKENREEVLAARKDARDARQKIKDAEVAKLLATVNIAGPLAPDQKEALLSRVQAETERAVAAAAVVKEAVSRLNKSRSDAVRTNAIAWTPDGRAFYRLKGVHDMNSVVLQAAEDVDSSELSPRDCWSIYPKEEEEVLFKYLSYRARASRKRSVADGELEEEEVKAKEAEEEKENRMPNSDFAKLETLS